MTETTMTQTTPECDAAETPPTIPPAHEADAAETPCWRLARIIGLGQEPIAVRGGMGSEQGNTVVQFHLMHPTPPGGLTLPEAEFFAPIRAALMDHLKASPARERYLALDAQHRAAAQRLAVAKARVAKIQADRALAEAQAPANLGQRLVKLTKDAAAVADEVAVADAELKELEPLRQAAHRAIADELRQATPRLMADASVRARDFCEDAKAAALGAILDAAGEALLEYVRRHETVRRYFFTASPDLTGLVLELLDQDRADALRHDPEGKTAPPFVRPAPPPPPEPVQMVRTLSTAERTTPGIAVVGKAASADFIHEPEIR